ncbi:cytokinin hydroxylase-like [Macadamia integrifolia]|uniref:cytokinin hydroxylase-like n=1 Tax=Macadamia integrifolia TaxID=60698 RepID=UPI001C4F49C8|nr:cytokinin hydroxylase-like [Macadamia integrifolia]
MATILILAVLFPLVFFFLKVAYEIITCYWLTPRRIKKKMEKQGVYGPKPRFLVGNIPDMATLIGNSTSKDMDWIDHNIVGRLMPHYVAWSKQYGKRFIYWVGSEPRMCLTEIDMIKELLSSKYCQVSGKSWIQRQGTKHFIGKGLLMANGNDWYHQRHIAAPAFMAEKLKRNMGYMVECTKQMLETLVAVVKSGETEIEIGEYMTHLTADVISRTEFDSSYEKGKQIFHHLTSLQHLCAQSNRYVCLPGSRFFPSKFNKEIKALKMEVEKLLMEIIERRKECVEIGRSSSYGSDLLGMLLEETQKKRASGFSYTLEMVMDECKTFFFAGHETTALLLTWTVMLLATNPSWQDKVREEVFQVCNGEAPSTDQLSRLSVLNMVINESLRLYPPASLLPRMAFEDIKLGELLIPKGLSIWIPVLTIHHDEELWGKDVHEFNPERFAAKSFGRPFMPFASGPRNCIGQTFAIMEAKVILSMLIAQFSFTISKNYRHAPISVLTLKPKHGVPIYLKPLSP